MGIGISIRVFRYYNIMKASLIKLKPFGLIWLLNTDVSLDNLYKMVGISVNFKIFFKYILVLRCMYNI